MDCLKSNISGCGMPKVSWRKLSRMALEPRNLRKFSPLKVSRYTVSTMTIGLGDIPVLRYYRDKYIHDNTIVSILAYRDNHANDNTATTATTVDTTCKNHCLLCNVADVYSIVPLASCALAKCTP